MRKVVVFEEFLEPFFKLVEEHSIVLSGLIRVRLVIDDQKHLEVTSTAYLVSEDIRLNYLVALLVVLHNVII